QAADKMDLSKAETEDILFCCIKKFTLDRLVENASRLLEPIQDGTNDYYELGISIIMTIIAFISQKGETTTPSKNWPRMKPKKKTKNKYLTVNPFTTFKEIIQQGKFFDLIIIDGPACTSQGTLEIAKVANLVIQPTGSVW
ncbi:26719_t:CDS:2, partial [Dentiscutata erythropus]